MVEESAGGRHDVLEKKLERGEQGTGREESLRHTLLPGSHQSSARLRLTTLLVKAILVEIVRLIVVILRTSSSPPSSAPFRSCEHSSPTACLRSINQLPHQRHPRYITSCSFRNSSMVRACRPASRALSAHRGAGFAAC